MKLNAETFANLLWVATRIRHGGSQMPILNAVRLSSIDGKLEILATDLDTVIDCRMPAKLEPREKLGIVVDGKSLYGVIAALKANHADVELEVREGNATERKLLVTAGGRKIMLRSDIATEDWPTEPDYGKVRGSFTLGPGHLAPLAWVAKAVSKDETRYNMSGLYLGERYAVATDTHRLHRADLGVEIPFSGLVSQPAFSTFFAAAGIVKPAEIVVNGFGFQDEKKSGVFAFRFDLATVEMQVSIRTRAIEGIFPPYESVIPKPESTKGYGELTQLPVEVLRSAATLATKMGAKAAKFTFDDDGELRLLSNLGDDGEWAEIIAVSTRKALEVGLNLTYVLDVLNARAGMLTISATDDTSPLVFESDEALPRLGVLMPMRV